jgi:hypothetical protein
VTSKTGPAGTEERNEGREDSERVSWREMEVVAFHHFGRSSAE